MKRRNFLKHTSAATLAALAGDAPRLLAAKQATQLRPKADCMILLWMAGGMAHTETFDPKRHTDFSKGVEAKDSDQSPDINCNSENGKSLAQATSLCTAMKAAVNGGKIEVFTVGFQVSTAAKTFLTNCATDAAHYYDATTEVALQAAFRDIALKISTLRLTN